MKDRFGLRIMCLVAIVSCAVLGNLVALNARPGAPLMPGFLVETRESARLYWTLAIFASMAALMFVAEEASKVPHVGNDAIWVAAAICIANLVVALGIPFGAMNWIPFQTLAVFAYPTLWMAIFSYALMDIFPTVLMRVCQTS